MSPRTLSIAILLALLVLGPTARADIVLHDGGAEADREVSDLVKTRTGKAPKTVLSADVLSGPSRPLAAFLTVERCEGELAPVDLGPRLDAIRDAVLSFDLERAEKDLAVLQTLLPCAKDLVAADQIATMWFFSGAARLDKGDEPGGRRAMEAALAVSPGFEGPKGFPKAHLDLLAASRAGNKAAAHPLYLWSGRAPAEVFVDGVVVPQAATAGASLTPGRHLVQLRWEDRAAGLWVVTEAKPAALVEPASGRAIWADGGRSPGGELAMRLLLTDEFDGREGDVHIVQFRRGRAVGATWLASGGNRQNWDDRPVPAPEGTRPTTGGSATRPGAQGGNQAGTGTTGAGTATSSKTRRTPSARPQEARVRLAVGGGWMYAAPFHYATLAVDLAVRPVGPLVIAAFIRPAYGGDFDYPVLSGEDPVGGPVFLAPFGIAAGVQKPGDIAPYVRAAFQFAYNRDGLSARVGLFGALAQGGVDLSPKGSPFLARLQGEFGVMGDGAELPAFFTARLWGGVGARF